MTFPGALSTLLAWCLLLAVLLPSTSAVADDGDFSTSSSTFIPALKQFGTVYSSTQSSAGFMVDIRTKKAMTIFGLDVNLVAPSLIQDGPEARAVVYTKEGSFKGHEKNESAWELWMDVGIKSYGIDQPTPIPQKEEDAAVGLFVPARGKRSFYVAFEGSYLRYSEEEKLYYINHDLFFYGNGMAKRKGWAGGSIFPRTFNGGLHYYLSDEELDLQVAILPWNVRSESPTTGPTGGPTAAPSNSVAPSESFAPTEGPTDRPTEQPTQDPTSAPTAQPTSMEVFATKFEDAGTKPVLVYAGAMFDLEAREDIEIQTIAVNTYLTTDLPVQLYVREGGYDGAETDIELWTWWANVTVAGQGMGQPSYLPARSFEPILLRRSQTMGFYLATEGPWLRASKGEKEGKPHAANPDLVVYQGVGKRRPITGGTIAPRNFNGAFGYYRVDIPTPSPTIDARDLFVRSAPLAPVRDTYVQEGVEDETFGRKAQLKVDGRPGCVALMEFDAAALHGGTNDAPEQVLSAVLRLYSMTGSEFGGRVSIVPGGGIGKDQETWSNSPYAEEELGIPVGAFRSVWPEKFYEMDITHFFRDHGIPSRFVVRVASDRDNGVMYRSSDGARDNGPLLNVTFAYDPDTKKKLAREFGSDPPTATPTARPTEPEWEDSRTPANPGRTYFNYRPESSYGPDRWYRIAPDGYYDKLQKLKTDVWRNRCGDGRRQSPRDLCRTSDECLEYHETRNRRGQYGLGARNETKARPTPHIMHNKLRLSYRERRSEWEEPIPPGADFARNGLNSGVQDLIHIDLKVRSEHRLCGKQYDAEMQLYYLHNYGNLEAVGVLVNGDGEERNDHFQKLLDFFQLKFDADKALCGRKQRMARALLADGRDRRLRGRAALEADQAEEVEDFDEHESPLSLASVLYQNLQNRILRVVHRKAQDIRWDPLKPWDIYKSVHFWSYTGSTTEPPCFEDVKWRIVDVPMTISPLQLIQLKKLMFDHVDPTTCAKTSTHYDESNARPVQPYRGGAVYRCRRSDYASDAEREASGRVKGFNLREKWRGVDMLPYVEPEFPNV